jgi:two-component system response regulator AtoC
MTKISVLVVDDDASFRTYVTLMLRARGYVTEGVESGDDLFRRLSSGANPPSVILLDVNLPDADGIEVIGKLRGLGVRVPVIMLSGIGHVRTVVEAMKLGALDFLMKPFTDTALENAIRTAFEDGVRVCELSQPLTVVDGEARSFVTLNPRMRRLADIVQRVARTDVPVLITGESGVGKEVIARHAHRHSGRHDKPFIKVNCAAMPRDLLESELFGYERGAFTGAVSDKPGKFELAHTGTLLLDEIGEMSPLLQAKLLHVLQDGVFSRLGSTKTMRVDTRIIAATNINIEDAVAQGKFREDLYYRLNVIRIDLPPLRERREDIPALCNQFIEMYRERYKSTVREIPLELMNRFAEYGWPGNVRELENAIKRFLVLPQHDIILDSSPTNAAAPGAPPAYLPLPPGSSLLAVASAAADRAQLELVRQVLKETHGNRKAAARRMNICYKALLNKLKRWETANAIPSRQFDKTGEVAVS